MGGLWEYPKALCHFIKYSIEIICFIKRNESFLHPFIYQYIIRTNGGIKKIELRFNYENFCHLLGLETVAKDSVAYKNLHNYRGLDGWDNVCGSIINIVHLRRLNKRKLQSVKAKLVYFYLLPELLAKPLAVNFNNYFG